MSALATRVGLAATRRQLVRVGVDGRAPAAQHRRTFSSTLARLESPAQPKTNQNRAKYFSIEVQPLMLGVGLALCAALGIGIHHLRKDYDIRTTQPPAAVDSHDEPLKKALGEK